jgi:hypothetical protein
MVHPCGIMNALSSRTPQLGDTSGRWSHQEEVAPPQKALDRKVQLRISPEMGHEREQITAVYLGR